MKHVYYVKHALENDVWRHDALPTFLLKTKIRKVKQDTFFDIFTLPDFYCDKNSILKIECYNHTYAKLLGEESIWK